MFSLITQALADTGQVPVTTVDLTGVATAIIAGVFSLLGVIIPLIINKYIKDKQAASVLNAAIENALGAIQSAAEDAAKGGPLRATVPGVAPEVSVGVKYVLDHAGKEAERFNLSPELIADKISAKIGLTNIETNLAHGSKMMAVVHTRTIT